MTSRQDDKQADQELDQLRQIVFGAKGEHVKQALNPQARELVADVVSEALQARQKSDKSVQQVVTPLVEGAVERSVASHSEKFTSILYPLVGKLVRKSVSAFLTQFIEKTNDILESAFTIKGLVWRYRAWRSGMSFSQYVVSQTYAYRVEQILLIHRETGLLIKSVALDPAADEDADLISSMLTAINDFVSDSFQSNSNQQQLDEIKTDDVSLFIFRGQDAALVAATTGALPFEVRQQFEDVISDIQLDYAQELQSFEGDSQPFEVTDGILRDCLVSKEKQPGTTKKKTPWFGYLFVMLVIAVISWLIYQSFALRQLRSDLEQLDSVPGVLITKIEAMPSQRLRLSVLRDLASQPIDTWLANEGIDASLIEVVERPFVSLDNEIIYQKLRLLCARYDQIQLSDKQPAVLTGRLGWQQMQSFNREYYAIPGIQTLKVDRTALELEKISMQAEAQPAIQRQLFEQIVGEIARVQISFAVNETMLDSAAIANINTLTDLLNSAFELAQKLSLNANLIIIGASDTTGVTSINKRLSLKRANAVKTALINQGINVEKLFSAGIGEVTLSSNSVATRKVMFNVMYTQTHMEQVE